MLHLFVDADACPVKEEVYRVARRCGLKVTLVANSPMRVPAESAIVLEVVGDRFDASDDWIVERVEPRDIVITGDIPLASRCLKKGALVLGHKGREFTLANIGTALATRQILANLRDMEDRRHGPPPFEKRDRSRFLQSLDSMIRAVKSGRPTQSDGLDD